MRRKTSIRGSVLIAGSVIYLFDLTISAGVFLMTAREDTWANLLTFLSLLLFEPAAFLLAMVKPFQAGCLLAGITLFSGSVALISWLQPPRHTEVLGALWFAVAYWGPKFALACFMLRAQRAWTEDQPSSI